MRLLIPIAILFFPQVYFAQSNLDELLKKFTLSLSSDHEKYYINEFHELSEDTIVKCDSLVYLNQKQDKVIHYFEMNNKMEIVGDYIIFEPQKYILLIESINVPGIHVYSLYEIKGKRKIIYTSWDSNGENEVKKVYRGGIGFMSTLEF